MQTLPCLVLQLFWKVLSVTSKPTWQFSKPVPLITSGTLAAAQIAVSPNATLTVALHTKEQPHRLQMVTLKGNPMGPPTDPEGTLPVQCLPMGDLDLHTEEEETLVQFLFEPHSAGLRSSRLLSSPI